MISGDQHGCIVHTIYYETCRYMTASLGDRTCPGDAAEVIKLAGVLANAKLLPALRTNSRHEQLQMHCWQQAIATQQASCWQSCHNSASCWQSCHNSSC